MIGLTLLNQFFRCFFLQRSVVEVQWKGSSKKNIYRLGHKGKVSFLVIQVC